MQTSTAAVVALGHHRLEQVQLPIPEIDEHGPDGLLRVEACGICGSDVKKYGRTNLSPTIMGHETVGIVERAGTGAMGRWGVAEGDRVLLEEYLPCGHCGYCRSGEFRSCAETETIGGDKVRYGSTPVSVEPSLWGGYSQYQYLHPSSVLHPVPASLAPEHAAFAIPMSNGIQWAQHDAGVRAGDVVVIFGPGQQGLAVLIAAKQAGAGPVFVCGLSRDERRLAIARELGADVTVTADSEDVLSVVRDHTGGHMADVVLDNSGGGTPVLLQGLGLLRKRGTFVLASGGTATVPDPDLNPIRLKQLTVKGVRGHSYEAVEAALALLASGAVPFDLLSAGSFPLSDLERALVTASGATPARGVHVSVDPWSS